MLQHTLARCLTIAAPSLLVAAASAQVHINEVYISHVGTDDQEYIELIGAPNTLLDGYFILVVEGQGAAAGTLDRVWDLTGEMIGASGYFVAGGAAVPNVDLVLGTTNLIENGTETIYLVNDELFPGNFASILGSSVRVNPSHSTIPLLSTIVDAVAPVSSGFVSGADEVYDGATVVGPDGTFFPAGILRAGDYPAEWCDEYLDFDDEANQNLPRTPGALNSDCSVLFNEIYVSHDSTDDQEYIELAGTSGQSLDGYFVLVVEGDGAGAGTLDRVYDLSGNTIPASGLFVLGDDAVVNLNLSIGATNTLENGTQTYYLVNEEVVAGNLQALLGTNVATAMGATTTVIPNEATILDLVGQADGGISSGDIVFDGATVIGPDGSFGPAGFFRGNDQYGDWCNNFLDFDDNVNANLERTPGTPNIICCQEDLGQGGPGDAILTICGGPFTPANTQGVDLVVSGGEPNAVGGLLFSMGTNPIPFAGGTIVPDVGIAPPPIFVVLDANGGLQVDDIPNGGFQFTAYVQLFYVDANQTAGVGISNAVQWEFEL